MTNSSPPDHPDSGGDSSRQSISVLFESMFGSQPAACVRAPGRVNLIGEHIDYNGGHVLPIAIDRGVDISGSLRADGQFRLYSAQVGQLSEGPLPDAKQSHWTDYVFGVVHEFRKLGHSLPGLDAVVNGTIPRASGLSSSAALEVATAWLVQQLLGTSLSRIEIALLGQRAENKFVGVNCGIMDQAASACATADHALLLDCNTLQMEQVPLNLADSAAILVAHSGIRRGLSASAYNQRRRECDEAYAAIRAISGPTSPSATAAPPGNAGIPAGLSCLCAATAADLDAAADGMSPTSLKRARHAICEEQRVQRAVDALRAANLAEFGEILNSSHASLRDDYDVSCPELDRLTETIRSYEGAYGARLTGAGFGGCVVALVHSDAASRIIADLKRDYYAPSGIEPLLFVTAAHAGAEALC